MLSISRYGRTIRFNCFYILMVFPCIAVVSAILLPSEKYLIFDIDKEKVQSNSKCIHYTHDFFGHDIDDMYTYDYHMNLLSCMFFIDPDEAEKPHYLVIGSKTMLGIEICNLLKKSNINFGEIRDYTHFNLQNFSIIRYLRSVMFSTIINLEHLPPDREKEFINYCEHNKINYITVSQNPKMEGNYKNLIIDKPLFGSSHNIFQDFPNSEILSLEPPELYKMQNFDEYYSAKDIANEIIKQIQYNNFAKSEKSIPISSTIYKKDNILNYIRNYRTMKSVDINLQEKVKEMYYFHEDTLSDNKEPYLTHVTTLSEDESIMKRFNLTCYALDSILSEFPDIPFEFLIVYCTRSNQKLSDQITIPKNLKKFIRVIEVPLSYWYDLGIKFETVGFPEYQMRNIGIRRAKGTYITCGSADVILPYGFFEAIRIRAFTEISYIRTTRISSPPDLNTIFDLYRQNTDVKQLFVHPGEESNFDVELFIDACGDFQGMHRDAWNMIHGYAESRFTYNIDALLAFDRAALAGPILLQHFSGGIHIEHDKVSNLTQHVDPWDEELRIELAKGRLTYISRFPRRYWGAENVNFSDYRL
ncbi:hypothetical protein TVAG_126170 [Trichomonas vaginalis G3]|uniref:Uncharacterized protein n=1 Tax=Trichomonas vaginalis (strain ATCC PRA-98 / G3) TaxID=412133 RepID=A2ED05_TRIV3|nr:nucleotide-diphospho-sugar transferases family [Trichomonas vaginalis G3]EAY09456.1 hypothetical protein TVAG_126170 [Trichomonas vaginalis G3]KAI5500649.1 nucleotide-diphospho-sugar transferases family [Trichomonas vaginalis G3]|eukprot:XP_001321679.1 hypothetical protein [Trichomonas vaginalis G3]